MLKHTEGEGLWLGGWMKEGERVNTDTNSVVIASGKWGGGRWKWAEGSTERDFGVIGARCSVNTIC